MSFLTNVEINSSLCILLFHLYILLNNSTEEQLLIRLFNVIPQIVSSYQNEEQINETATASNSRFFSAFLKNMNRNKENNNTLQQQQQAGSSTTNLRDSSNSHPLLSSSSSNRSSTEDNDNDDTSTNTNSENNNNNNANTDFDLDADDTEFNLNEAGLFLAQFLLKIYENVFSFVDRQVKFGMNMCLEAASHLTTTCSAALARDFQTNTARDLNYTQQLLLNKLMFLLYMVNSGHFVKMSNSVGLLVNDKLKSNRQYTNTSKGN